VAEVNAVSNIRLSVDLERRGREVARIRFRIAEAPGDPEAPSAPEEVQPAASEMSDLRGRLRDLGVADRLARQWIAEHGEVYVNEKLDYVAARSRDGKVRGSPIGYLSAAIRDDYRAPMAGAATRFSDPSDGAVGEARRAATDQSAARDRLAALRRSLRAARFDAVEAIVSTRDPDRRDEDRRRFLSSLQDETDREDFRQRGWRSALNAKAIFAFWDTESPGALPTLEQVAAGQGVSLEALMVAAGEAEPSSPAAARG
jgi:hypothetical protein